MKGLTKIIIGISLLTLAGCAIKPEDDPAFVSPNHYDGYNCRQIKAEMQRVYARIDQKMQTEATQQVLDTAVAVFAISRGYGVSGSDDTELRRLKNQYDVLDQASIKKDCR